MQVSIGAVVLSIARDTCLDGVPDPPREPAKEPLHRRGVMLDFAVARGRGRRRARTVRHVRRHPQERNMECGLRRHFDEVVMR